MRRLIVTSVSEMISNGRLTKTCAGVRGSFELTKRTWIKTSFYLVTQGGQLFESEYISNIPIEDIFCCFDISLSKTSWCGDWWGRRIKISPNIFNRTQNEVNEFWKSADDNHLWRLWSLGCALSKLVPLSVWMSQGQSRRLIKHFNVAINSSYSLFLNTRLKKKKKHVYQYMSIYKKKLLGIFY